jgi:hypothetical protein
MRIFLAPPDFRASRLDTFGVIDNIARQSAASRLTWNPASLSAGGHSPKNLWSICVDIAIQSRSVLRSWSADRLSELRQAPTRTRSDAAAQAIDVKWNNICEH